MSESFEVRIVAYGAACGEAGWWVSANTQKKPAA